jgi:hypothetical protein
MMSTAEAGPFDGAEDAVRDIVGDAVGVAVGEGVAVGVAVVVSVLVGVAVDRAAEDVEPAEADVVAAVAEALPACIGVPTPVAGTVDAQAARLTTIAASPALRPERWFRLQITPSGRSTPVPPHLMPCGANALHQRR